MDNQDVLSSLRDPDRLRILHALGLLDSPADPAFDRLTRLVVRLLQAPVSLVSLVDADRQFFISSMGLSEPWNTARQTPLSHSFCQYVVASRAPFVARDARADPRVTDNLAIPDLDMIAYAGVPLITPEGVVLGSLCAIDHEPRDWSDADLALLADLAAGVMAEVRRSRAERAEQRAEAHLTAVLASVPDAIWSADPEHCITTCNQRSATLFAQLTGAVVQPGTPLIDLYPPEEYPAWVARYDRALAGETFTLEDSVILDGARHWFELVFRPIQDRLGVQGVTVIGRDVTARRTESDTLRHLGDKNARLYAITAALAQAQTQAQVATIVVGQGIAALGAYAGALLLRSPDGQTLTLEQAIGYPPEVIANWPSRTIHDPYPVAEAVRTGVAVWLASLTEGARRYPRLPVAPGSPAQALAAIPLLLNGEAVAVIALSFDTPQAFPDEDRAFMLALADQCAQALDRARLLESLQRELVERQRAEAALRDNEARLDGILHSAMDAIITVNTEQRIVRFNHAAEQLFGYWAKDMIGQPLDRLIPPRFRAAHRQGLPAFGATGVTSRSMRVHQTLTALRANGEEFPMEAAISHVTVADEHWYTVILRDISARLAAEAALKASEARFTAFMNRIPAAAWICGADGVVRYINPSYHHLFAPASDAPIGKHLRELYPPDAADAYLAANQEVIAQGQLQELILSHPRQDGTLGQFLVYKFPLAAYDRVPLIGGIAIDITERAAAEAQQRALERSLLETQKLESLGVLAGGIAHDFNNLLVAILGNIELALLDLEAQHPAHASVMQVGIASRRAADLTRQLLAYSGRGRFVVEPLDLNALVEELGLLLRASVPKGVRVHAALAPALPTVEADATQLRQVLMNLVINGAEAMEASGGQVEIRTTLREVDAAFLAMCTHTPGLSPGPYIEITVSDTGCGMDATTMDRIFEPFFTSKFAGRGLGMAAVLGIVRGHQGAIHLTSSVGEGTTIRVLLPPSGALVSPPALPSQHPQARPSITLLVIDDEPEVRTVTTRMLERLGYAVVSAASGQAGVEQLAVHPELAGVLLDLTMPGLSGEETLRRIRQLRADLPVVVVSGYSAFEVHTRMNGIGAVEVLQKPFTPQSLREILHCALGREAAPYSSGRSG